MRWLALLVLISFSGCLNDFDDPETNYLHIAGIDVAAPHVLSGTVHLEVATTLDNLHGRSGNLNITVKAFSTTTGLLVDTQEATVGAIPKDKTESITTTFSLPKQGGYRFVVDVHEDGRRVESGTVTVHNVDNLPPTLFETGLKVSGMDFLIRDANASRVVIATTTYITNEGDSPSRTLRIQMKAREVSTGILADEAWLDLPAILPEATRPMTQELRVPNGYNYVVEAVFWEGDIIVERGEGNVQLLPTFVRDKDTEIVVSTPDISQFVDRDVAYARGPGYAEEAQDAPGFAIAIVLATLALAAIFRRKP